ncbi:MAG: SCO family protein [Planctomycetota bacterium]
MARDASGEPTSQSFDNSTPEEAFAAFVDSRSTDNRSSLVELLRERHPIYSGRSTNSIHRMRGYLMAAFERTGLPGTALPYVLETLESSFHPYTVAGAARALRGVDRVHPSFANYLVKAIFQVWRADQPVSFESYHVQWPLETFSTAVTEILETLEGFGGRAISALGDLKIIDQDYQELLPSSVLEKLQATIHAIECGDSRATESCCSLPVIPNSSHRLADQDDFDPLLEDQDGREVAWNEYFRDRYSVLAFFYTRCTNPKKCTLTIQTLVRVQRMLRDRGVGELVRTAAISYDTEYDHHGVLRAYGDARRFAFSADNRMFRVTRGFTQVLESLDLGVNYKGDIVNHHRIEFFLLDCDGNVVDSFVRLKVDPETLVDAVCMRVEAGDNDGAGGPPATSSPSKRGLSHYVNGFLSLLLPLGVALFPKCPFCWASYMGILGLAGFGTIPYMPWLLPLLLVTMGVNLCLLFWGADRRNGKLPFVLSCAGTVHMLIVWGFGREEPLFLIPGMLLLAGGAFLNSLSYRHFNRLKLLALNGWYGRPRYPKSLAVHSRQR